MPIPSIVSNADALRQRRQLEHEMRVAATVARARQHWSNEWQKHQIPLGGATHQLSPAPTGGTLSLPMPPTLAPVSAAYQPVFDETYWGTLTVGGLRRDKLVGYSHMAAFTLHVVLMITTIIVSAGNSNNSLTLWRSRFLFTLVNNSYCAYPDNLTAVTEDKDRIVSVLVNNGDSFNVAVATASFFGLSAFFHGIWIAGALWYEPLGALIFGWLAQAYAPLRWCACAPSLPPPHGAHRSRPLKKHVCAGWNIFSRPR